jgi:hypothetical protein
MKLPIENLSVPVGAMQFEVDPRETHIQAKAPVIWVLPPVPRVDFTLPCNCRRVYPVIEELIPDKFKPAMEANRRSRSPRGKFFVCACMGRVIE